MKLYQFKQDEFDCLENLRTPLAVYQFIDKRVVTRVLSAGFCDLFDFSSREEAYEVMRGDMYSTAHPDDAARVADAAYRFATEGGRYEVVYRVKTRKSFGYKIVHALGEHVYKDSGERLAYVWYTDEGSYTGERDPHQSELSAVFRSALHEESLLQQSHYDSLTGLPNMSYFLELVDTGRESLRQEGKTPALLFFDLNGMRFFNLKHGFAEGNRLLRAFSLLLGRYFGGQNSSRFGQDHFAAFTSTDGLAERLDQFLLDCAALNEGRSVSVRVGVYPDSAAGLDAIVVCDRAKIACDSLSTYRSAYAFFDEHMLQDLVNRQYIIDHFEKALAERWIKVYYQPIIRAANGRVCDEEALSRWIDPVKGMLSPAEFIPALEEAKLIYKLDLYVVEQVLAKMETQAAAGLFVVPISVNLSRSDFDCCDIVEEIRKRVDASGIGRDKLTIEITESVVGSDFAFMKAQVERFHELGFQVWMDDFGSGYSSLDVLQDIHFDVIKFDMRFMQRFDESEEGKIILTELIRMAIGLRIETVCEGVETSEQVEFLREVGCTKLQGFYFCRPIPLDGILARYAKGVQIGFENPEETDYYAAIGRINLYDTAVLAREDKESLRNFFNTVPMAIIETTPSEFSISRCNNTYRSFMIRAFGQIVIGVPLAYANVTGNAGLGFLRAMRQCGMEGNRLIVDEVLPDGSTVHAFLKRIAFNPVTGTSAVAVAVLAILEKTSASAGLSYAQIANALSTDYFDLFYVDLDTEHFVHYSSSGQSDALNLERLGEDFFNASRRDARKLLYVDDQAEFLRVFTKENVLHTLDTQGSFTTTYRLLMDGEPIFVNMKAVRMKNDPKHIIIGVNNINAQMQEKQMRERLEEERSTYARISALAGDYICFYTVDPESGSYVMYNASDDYEKLNLSKSGGDFFGEAIENSENKIFADDLEAFKAAFSKENILQAIRDHGVFEYQYRLLIKGEPKYVILRAAMLQEKGGPLLIVGINNVDARVRREMEYAHKLSVARSRANIDALTGVKNRFAYQKFEELLDAQIAENRQLRFAVALFDVHGIRKINEEQGRESGDQALRRACSLVCMTFKHSPVFRIEDDRFAVISRGQDYESFDTLLEQFAKESKKLEGVSVGCASAAYTGEGQVSDIFAQADKKLRRDEV